MEQLPLALRVLLREQVGRLLGQAEDQDPVLDVAAVRVLVAGDGATVRAELVVPGVGVARVRLVVDEAVELVDVHRVEPPLEARALDLQALDRVAMEPDLVVGAAAQGVDDELHVLLWLLQAAQREAELAVELLLAHEGLPARALEAGAAVVDVPLLLDLRREGATAVRAADQPDERELPGTDRLALPLVLVLVDRLDAVPRLTRGQRPVDPGVADASPLELAHVDGVVQDHVDQRLADGLLGAARHEAGLTDLLRERQHGEVARGGPLEQPGDQWPGGRVDLDGALAVVAQHVAVADRRRRRPDPLRRLLPHALGGLLRQVVDVVLGHQHADAVHELLGRPRVVAQDRAFLDEMDLEVEVVEGDPVLQVPVQAVGLLDQDHLGRVLVLAQVRQHLAEVGSPGALRRLDVDELLHDGEAVVGGVLLEELELRGHREAFALLVA